MRRKKTPDAPERPKLYLRGTRPPNKGAAAAMKALWASPEGKAKMAARTVTTAAKRAAAPHSRAAIPNGMTRASVAPLVAQARQQADRFIQKMKDEGVLPTMPNSDEERAEAVLKQAVVIALSPGERQSQMAAIRTVLEWTRAKPASKQHISLDTTESWLAEIAANDAKA